MHMYVRTHCAEENGCIVPWQDRLKPDTVACRLSNLLASLLGHPLCHRHGTNTTRLELKKHSFKDERGKGGRGRE